MVGFSTTATGAAPLLPRARILGRAQSLICGDRAASYGNYEDQMNAISAAFNAITGKDLSPQDISTILQLLKLRRMQTTSDPDSAVDLCGYAALHAEFFLNELPTT
jgi:hypothetical protein